MTDVTSRWGDSCVMRNNIIAATGERQLTGEDVDVDVVVWSGEEGGGLRKLYDMRIGDSIKMAADKKSISVAADGDFIVLVHGRPGTGRTVQVLQAVDNVVREVRLIRLGSEDRFVVDYPRMVFTDGAGDFLLDLESGDETTQAADWLERGPVIRPVNTNLNLRSLLSYPFVLTFQDETSDVTVYNVVTNKVVGRSRLDTMDRRDWDWWRVSTNGRIVAVTYTGSQTGITLLGLPNENEELWSRGIDMENVSRYGSCAINKTCVVRGVGNELIVENYWMTMEDEAGDENGEDTEGNGDGGTDDMGEKGNGYEDEGKAEEVDARENSKEDECNESHGAGRESESFNREKVVAKEK